MKSCTARTRERLKHVYIDNLSFEKFIPNWDREGTLFYCDPPYAMLLDKACPGDQEPLQALVFFSNYSVLLATG